MGSPCQARVNPLNRKTSKKKPIIFYYNDIDILIINEDINIIISFRS